MLGSVQWTDKCFRPSTEESCSIYKSYERVGRGTLAQRRLRRTYYLSRVDHVGKIKDRKQRTDIGTYSFVSRAIKNWNQVPAG
jgi:hypothetical protein